MVLRGFTTNWEKYEELKARWEMLMGGVQHCKLHDTYFVERGEDGEPCWQCWDSCQEEVEGND